MTSTSDTAAAYVRRLAWQLEGTDIELLVVPGLVEVAPDRLAIRPTKTLPLIEVREPVYRGIRWVAKTAFDRLMALTLLILGRRCSSPSRSRPPVPGRSSTARSGSGCADARSTS